MRLLEWAQGSRSPHCRFTEPLKRLIGSHLFGYWLSAIRGARLELLKLRELYYRSENARIYQLFLDHEWFAPLCRTSAIYWWEWQLFGIRCCYQRRQTRKRRHQRRTSVSIRTLRFLVSKTPGTREPERPGLRSDGNHRSERETALGFLRHHRFFRQIVAFCIRL